MDNKIEPKETVAVDDSFDAKADEFMAGGGEGKPADSSAAKDNQSDDTELKEDAGDDQLKKSDSEGKADADGKKAEDPRDLMFRKGYNEAKAKADKEREALLKSIPPKEALEQFNKTVNTPEYIRASMKAQGYTDEAVNKKLGELGHKVEAIPGDDVELVIGKLGLDPKGVDENQRNVIADFAKISRVIFDDMYGKAIPGEINPLKETLGKITSREEAKETISEMKRIVGEEKILDFDKDIEPALQKFLDEHEKEFEGLSSAEIQGEVFNYFKDFHHSLSVERLRGGKRKEELDKSKLSLRGISKTVPIGSLPKKSGDYDTDADAFLSAFGT